jgi:hypothetical protein
MIQVLQKLSEEQKALLRSGVIEVSGRAMNRTALGVVDAVLQLYPDVTLEELKTILPDAVNPAAPKNYRSLFKPYTTRPYGVFQPGSIRGECEAQGLDLNASHFTGEGEVFRLKDGTEILVSKSWESSDTETGEHDLQNLVRQVEPFGIRVVEFEKGRSFGKGGYSLETVNPALMAALQAPAKKPFPVWLLVLLALLLVGAGLFFLFGGKGN